MFRGGPNCFPLNTQSNEVCLKGLFKELFETILLLLFDVPEAVILRNFLILLKLVKHISLTERLKCFLYTDLLSCNFDNQTLCGWTTGTSGQFNWTLNEGATTTAYTGPKYDHTTTSKPDVSLFLI